MVSKWWEIDYIYMYYMYIYIYVLYILYILSIICLLYIDIFILHIPYKLYIHHSGILYIIYKDFLNI